MAYTYIYIGSIGVRINPLMNNNHCDNDLSCHAYGLTSNITEVLLPRETMSHLEKPSDCSIVLGCSYEIVVETSKLKIFKNITYNVPGKIIIEFNVYVFRILR